MPKTKEHEWNKDIGREKQYTNSYQHRNGHELPDHNLYNRARGAEPKYFRQALNVAIICIVGLIYQPNETFPSCPLILWGALNLIRRHGSNWVKCCIHTTIISISYFILAAAKANFLPMFDF